MRTPEGWHKAWRKNAALFQNAANTKKTRAHNGSEFPSSRLAALACYAVAGAYGSRERSLPLARTFGLTASRERLM